MGRINSALQTLAARGLISDSTDSEEVAVGIAEEVRPEDIEPTAQPDQLSGQPSEEAPQPEHSEYQPEQPQAEYQPEQPQAEYQPEQPQAEYQPEQPQAEYPPELPQTEYQDPVQPLSGSDELQQPEYRPDAFSAGLQAEGVGTDDSPTDEYYPVDELPANPLLRDTFDESPSYEPASETNAVPQVQQEAPPPETNQHLDQRPPALTNEVTVSFDELELSTLFQDELEDAEEERMLAALPSDPTTPYEPVDESSSEEIQSVSDLPSLAEAESEEGHDDDVMRLVGEVLGIPGLPAGASQDPAAGAINPIPESYELTDEETEGQFEPDHNYPDDPAQAAIDSPLTQEDQYGPAAGEENGYNPVMETWANVSHGTEPQQTPDAEIPAAPDDLGLPANEYRDAGLAEEAFDAAVAAQPPAASVEEINIAAIAPTMPSEYEVSLAERLLQTEFGDRVRQLGDHITGNLADSESQIVLVAGIDADPQRPDAVAGLGLLICAQRTQPTLIVDGDQESRLISQGFEKHEAGIAEILLGTTIWKQAVRPTSCAGLHVIPAGNIDVNASGIPQERSSGIGQIVAEWKKEYGLILIDGGITDSPLVAALAPHADATFVGVHLGTSQRDQLLEATEQLVSKGARVKGCITTGS